MVVAVADAELSGLLDAGDAWLDALAAVPVRPVDCLDAAALVARLEVQATRLYSVQVAAVASIDDQALSAADGHRGAKGLVVASAGVSGAVAARRVQVARALRRLPAVAAGLAAGRVGVGQVELIGRVFANPRVRDELIAADADLATVAELTACAEFDGWLRDWERLADADGAGVRAERGHANRDFRIVVLPDGNVRIDGGCGGLQGLILREVFDVYVQAEWDADWAEARARLGDAATYDDLARTDRQRRMDAVVTIFEDAIAHRNQCDRDGTPGHQLVINMVIDGVTTEATVARLAGVDHGGDPRLATWWHDLAATLVPEPAPDPAGEPTPRRVRPVGFRSETLDGHPLDPREIIVAAMNHHNRLKTAKGYTITRDRWGGYHLHRPDGTPMS